MKQVSLIVVYLLFHILFSLDTIQPQDQYEPRIPAPFDEKMLPAIRSEGILVENLGHIPDLGTFMQHTSVNSAATKFSIYTRSKSTIDITFAPSKYCISMNCYGPFQFDLNALDASGFNASKRTIIMISGYLSDDNVGWLTRTKDLWLQMEDVNVILVTWKDSNRYVYSRAVADTPLVARQITIFLYYLATLNGTNLRGKFTRNIHFIGHSLGAHVAGFVGKDLAGQMGRITALDPAGPSFDHDQIDKRLDVSDAELVDVIHTNMGKMRYLNAAAGALVTALDQLLSKAPLLNRLAISGSDTYTGEGDTAWYGLEAQVGHIDYYANGGRVQPGCEGLLHTCDHKRSSQIYEDILRYELSLRQFALNGSGTYSKSDRLIAFKSSDYDNFLSGPNLEHLCPRMLNEIDHLNGFSGAHIPECTIPIDFLTPLDEYKQELATIYKVNFHIVKPSTNRYFFKTQNNRPLAGDHYLLRLRLRRASSWDSSCKLQILLKMTDGSSMTLELNKELRVVNSEKFYGFAIPFIGLNGASAHNALDRILMRTRDTRDAARLLGSYEMYDLLEKILPSSIELRIVRAESTGVKEALKDKALHLFGLLKPSKNCHMGISEIEVHPLVGFGRNILGVYGEMPERDLVQFISVDQYKRNSRHEDGFELMTDFNQGFERRIHTVVFG